MEIFRISVSTFANRLSSSGIASRWNKNDQYVLYAGSSRSLSTLELIVHRSSIKPLLDYKVMVISIANDAKLIKSISEADLPTDWRKIDRYNYLQDIGSTWYTTNETLVLKVPSAIIPKEYNYVINTRHAGFKDNVRLSFVENYFWDDRLL